MIVLAIDPGPVQSAFVIWDGKAIVNKGILENRAFNLRDIADVLIVEQIKSYGMAVSDSIFDTCYWSGRLIEQWWIHTQKFYDRVPRREVKMHLCHSMRAKDSNIRAALIDRFGAPGTKKQPGTTYGLSKDLWAAFALAVYWYDEHSKELGE